MKLLAAGHMARLLIRLLPVWLLLAGCQQAAEPPVPPASTASQSEPQQAPAEKGVVMKKQLQSDGQTDYFLYAPKSAPAQGAKLFVTVHGVSRDAEEHARRLAPFAEASGFVLVSPLFSEKRFPLYQQLGSGKSPLRADRILEAIAAKAGKLTGADTSRLYLFGYSGGGQFVHRFAMAYPERVAKYVVGAAGWYTFPDSTLPYPQGVAAVAGGMADLRLIPDKFLQVPGLVVVGEKDTKRGDTLEKSPEIDARQGKTRVERGRRWVEAMNQAAAAQGIRSSYAYKTLPGCSHSFEQCMTTGGMGEAVFAFLQSH
jgi:pimeloyl-ACP methyl ester carboxylesterase